MQRRTILMKASMSTQVCIVGAPQDIEFDARRPLAQLNLNLP